MPQLLETRVVAADDSMAQTLIEAMVAELHVLMPGRRPELAPTATVQEMSPPHGGYVVLLADGEPVAGGGLKRLDGETGEVKRMYVAPAGRGQGLSRQVLGAIEDHARTLGYARLRLDTGPRQPAARHLYVTSGYAEIPDYNGNPYAAFWGEKRL